jgi:hypothetical protein
MKKLGIIGLIFCLISCDSAEKIVDNSGGIGSIPAFENHMNEAANNRKNKDVDVNKIVSENKQDDTYSYQINYYHNQTGQLNRYSGIVMSGNDYQSFKFDWKDDTTVTVTMFGKAAEEMPMTLFGNINDGVPSNGMYVPDDIEL